jgi:hypothetical protein
MVISLGLPQVGPKSGKGRDFNADAMSICVDVRFGESNAQCADSTKRSHPVEYCVREGFLKVVTSCPGKGSDFVAQEIVIPSMMRVIVRRRGDVLEPDLCRHQQTLRRPDFEFVETDVG